MRFLQSGNDHECNCHVPRESEPTREEIKAYLAEIFADVPDMKDSFVQWKHLSNTERKEKDQ